MTMAIDVQERSSSRAEKLAGKYLTFFIQKESYGIDVLQVRGIIKLTEITPVPRMPEYVRGVINLRGKIIPVIDLRIRFGFADVKNTDLTVIIVVQVQLPGGKQTQTGLIVDGVEEVTNIPAADIEEAPDFGSRAGMNYILGMAKVKGAVKALLDIAGVLGAEGAQLKGEG